MEKPNFEITNKKVCPVSTFNEWDPLEEVIVGVVDNAAFSSWNLINKSTVPPSDWNTVSKLRKKWNGIYPDDFIKSAQEDLNEFVNILISEGVTVRRPDIMTYTDAFSTPNWNVSSGFCAANPRDVFLVVGNEIIEAPMADRSRYFENWAYRSLLKEYFQLGAKWTSAPKPQLIDAQYHFNYLPFSNINSEEKKDFIITEFEPTFDAADFIRCGKDIFVQKSHATNAFGVSWIQRHLGDKYRFHMLESLDPGALHIDTTFVPLAPGKILVNPKYLDIQKLPNILNKWDILIAPEPINYTHKHLIGLVSSWISINVLMLDEKRVIVEKEQESLIRALKDWGFKPIKCSFKNYYAFGGSFHCATLDIRRKGNLETYF